MSNKEKWVDLFEQVVGRKPSPSEFLAGRDSGFDFKVIKRFVDEEQVVEEVAPEQDSLDLAQTAWLEAFEARTGRKPSPAEFTLAKSQGYDLSSMEQVSEVPTTPVLPQEPQVPQSPKKPHSLKSKLLALFGGLAVGLGGAYYYFDSQTGLDVAVETFGTAVKEKNYTALADLLSNKDKKWSNSDAKSFVTYLDEHFEGLDGDLATLVNSKGKYGLTDANDNVLVTFEPSEKVLGLFQNYQPKPEGITLTLKTNLSEATASLDGRSVSLPKDKETVLDHVPFVKEELVIKGKTGVGPIESVIVLDLNKVEANRLSLDLTAEKHQLNISLPSEATSVEKLELVVNGQKIAEGLTGEIEALSGQQLEVHANFTVNGDSYTTNKSKVVVGQDSLELILGLSSDTKKRLVDSEKAKKAKEDEAKKAKEAEKQKGEERDRKISEFLSNYRADVFDSIEDRSNYYAKYYDTSSNAYQEMVAWTTGGGVARAKIDYYVPGALNIKSITEENGSILVSTYEDFTVHYIDNTPNSVSRKNKVYYLKPVGDSFEIYRLDVR